MEPLMLLRGVREVAALANPAEPAAVAQRAFDAARARSPDHVALPPARRITERLKLSWREVLAVAHAPEGEQSGLLGAKDRAPRSTDWLTTEHVAAVLGIVAGRLSADTVSMSEYEAERGRIVAADLARWLHGRCLLMPTVEQVTRVAGSWGDALRLAGLRAQRERGPTRRKANAPPLASLMERFYDVHGVEPTSTALQEWARASRIPYTAASGRNAFATAKAAWIASRRARGLPDAKPTPRVRGRPTGSRPDYSRKPGAALPGERRLDKWDRAACVAVVARYLAQLRPTERSTSRGYRAWAVQQDHAPEMGTIQLHCGSWEAARREAMSSLKNDARPRVQ